MLWNREDAEDATQEILVRVVTRLSQCQHLSFEGFPESLVAGQEPASVTDTEQSMLIGEVKVGCSMAMLQCPNRLTGSRSSSATS
jgi:hypothetical protein